MMIRVSTVTYLKNLGRTVSGHVLRTDQTLIPSPAARSILLPSWQQDVRASLKH